MAGKVRLDYRGFNGLRRSPEMTDAINREARAIAERANQLAHGECADQTHAGFEYAPARDTDIGQVALASTGSNPGVIAHNAKHNTLAKAMGGS